MPEPEETSGSSLIDPQVREGEHAPPAHRASSFHCPWCGVLAQQTWTQHLVHTASGYGATSTEHSTCRNCLNALLWTNITPNQGNAMRVVFPVVGGGPRAHVDMPADVRADYEEARTIVGASPRGACALLRLATQKLVNDLQPDGGDLNDRIRRLVEGGLPPMVQQSLDVLRVIGNEAVHPGELDLRDDVETANSLFTLLNVIVEDRISRPRQIAAMYSKLPAGKLQGIVARDGGAQPNNAS
jgi:hypothetical protein